LAKAAIKCINLHKRWNNKREIYHFSNEGVASWYDFAFEIFSKLNIDCEVQPIPSSQYPTKAKRPHYSVLDKSKIKADFNLKIKHWKEAFDELNF
jgi:dTDP-4-dehydrorhamnose reductase